MITIRNTFHGTEACVRSTSLSGRTVRRVWSKLCGHADCTCGGTLGERGGDMFGPSAISDDNGNVYDYAPAPGYYDTRSNGGGCIELRIEDHR